MAKDLPSLGELELQVLRVVWHEQPCSERTVWDAIRADRDVGRTTVLKTIQRLEGKKLLSRKAGEGPVQYTAAVAENKVLPDMVRRFVEGALAGSLEPLVTYLAGSDKLSAKDLAALKAIAKKMAADDKTADDRA
jgi:predicted transcriptional regulator